jgi:hypothetical protein
LLVLVVIGLIAYGIWQGVKPDVTLIYTDGESYAEDKGDWYVIPGEDKYGNKVNGYGTREGKDYRFIFGGHKPSTLDDIDDGKAEQGEEIYSYAKNVKVCRVLLAYDGTYIVLRHLVVGDSYLEDPTWTTWSPELWDVVNKAQKLVD